MVYSDINFKTKKALKEAVASGKQIGVYQPGPFGMNKTDGSVCIEGPHYPEPHRWYATAEIVDGIIVKVE